MTEINSINKNVLVLGQSGTVYEDRKDFQSSLFANVYKRALQITSESIIKQQNYLKKAEPSERPYNIITFIGRRGTGKTSAML